MNETISVIVPLLDEAENLPLLLQALRDVMAANAYQYEIVLVDDGSSDDTWRIIAEEATQDARVVGVRLGRNFGRTPALRAGFDRAKGDICITMDGDLQHDPRHIPEFVQKIMDNYDMVSGYRHRRNDAFLRRFPSKIANYFARRFSRLSLQDFGTGYCAYRSKIIKDVPLYGEMHRFTPVFVNMLTARITEIPIVLRPRLHGKSKFGLSRTFRVYSDLLVVLVFARFFSRPIHVFGYMALLLGIPGFGILAWLTLNKLLWGLKIFNYGPLFMLGVLLCLVSVQLLTTGVVCEYLVRIYYSGQRKSYSISETTP